MVKKLSFTAIGSPPSGRLLFALSASSRALELIYKKHEYHHLTCNLITRLTNSRKIFNLNLLELWV